MLVAVEDQHSIAMRPGTSCLITDGMVVSGGPPLDVSYMTAHFIHGRKEEAWRVLGGVGTTEAVGEPIGGWAVWKFVGETRCLE